MDMAHKMAKQKFLSKKYIKNLFLELLSDANPTSLNKITNWSEYLKEVYEKNYMDVVYIDGVFEELEKIIKSDFGVKDEVSIFYDTNNDLKNNLYLDYFGENKITFKELINLIYKDIQNELNLPIKDRSYFINRFKDKIIDPIFEIFYFPLVLFCFVLFVIIFINGPSNAFIDLFDLDQIYGDIFGWALLFFFIYLFQKNTRKKQ